MPVPLPASARAPGSPPPPRRRRAVLGLQMVAGTPQRVRDTIARCDQQLRDDLFGPGLQADVGHAEDLLPHER